MTAANAYRWHAVTAALWQREPVAGGATCVLRERRGGYEMSVAGGAWRYAGPELRRAQEHAGGHACAADSAAVAQAMGACPICARLKTEG